MYVCMYVGHAGILNIIMKAAIRPTFCGNWRFVIQRSYVTSEYSRELEVREKVCHETWLSSTGERSSPRDFCPPQKFDTKTIEKLV